VRREGHEPALASDPRSSERFRREAKSAQKLAHPNIIEIFDQGETDDGTPTWSWSS
jgi:serine/threonine protein kinase